MAHFSIAHIVRLRDGTFAVRSAEFPSCEGRDMQMWPAREKFRAALSEHVRQMIEHGEMPRLYPSLVEAEVKFSEHCKLQLPADDRLPNSFDYATIVDLDLPPDDAERLAAIRIEKLLPESRM